MVFNSFHFVVFFAIVLALCAMLARRVAARNVMLLAASYYFYGCWDWRFLGLIIASTGIDYVCGRLLDDGADEPAPSPRRRMILIVSLLSNLGILGFFKYFDFFGARATEMLNNLGLEAHPATMGIILPVGISFYTFQTLSYTIDVYRGRLGAEKSLLNFAVFVAFFPQLVAGPIERAANFLPQVRQPSAVTWDRLSSGFYLIGWGLFKKVVLADNMAGVADEVFAAHDASAARVMLGVYAFAIQIYCDFSGYSDIARGAARCMGFDLMLNFNLPYFAVNPSDFWRRWHISLSSWLRDYLYIPLGGNRGGAASTYRNLMLTMILGGLWHGAAWTFIAWGALHGTLLCAHKALQPRLAQWFGWMDLSTGAVAEPTAGQRAIDAGWYWLRGIVFFHLVCIGWLLFRAESMTQAAGMLTALVTDFSLAGMGGQRVMHVLLAGGVLLAVQLVQLSRRDLNAVLRLPVPVRAAVYAGGMLAFMFFGEYGGHAFIYFQF